MRSVESARFAPSRISGAITASGLSGDLRFMFYVHHVKSLRAATTSDWSSGTRPVPARPQYVRYH
jgi:hypothetical protein